MVDHAGVGIALVQQRRIIRCNQQFADIFGHAEASQMAGHGTQALYPDEDSFHALGKAAYPVMAQGVPYKTEWPQKRRDGRVFWAHLTGTLIDPDDVARGRSGSSTTSMPRRPPRRPCWRPGASRT